MISTNIFSLLPHQKRYHSCVLTTFNFDYHYFKNKINSALNRLGIINRCVILDEQMLQQSLGTMSGDAIETVRNYSLHPIKSKGAFHPKLHLFFGDKDGFLIIGSGNITASGLGFNREIWGAFHINGASDPKFPIFKEAFNFVKGYLHRTNSKVTKKAEWIELNTPWLSTKSNIKADQPIITDEHGIYFLTTKKSSLLSQVTSIINPRKIEEITIIAPYFDQSGRFLRELKKEYNRAKINIVIQPDQCIPPFLSRKKSAADFRFFEWIDDDENSSRFLHAKYLHFREKNKEWLIFGSANPTWAAFGSTPKAPRNDEAVILLNRDKGNWLSEVCDELLVKPISFSDLLEANIYHNNPENLDEEDEIIEAPIHIEAVDRYHDRIHVFYKTGLDIKKYTISIFDGWGDICSTIKILGNSTSFSTECLEIKMKIPDKSAFCAITKKSGKKISNKQIINDVDSIIKSDPNPINQKVQELTSFLDAGIPDVLLSDILNLLSEEDLRNDKNPTEAQKSKADASPTHKDDSNEIGEVLSETDFKKTRMESDKLFSSLHHSQRKVFRFYDCIQHLLNKQDLDVDPDLQNEEVEKDKIESSEGSEEISKFKVTTTRRTQSVFEKERRKIKSFYERYTKQLQAFFKSKKKLDTYQYSLFVIILQITVFLFSNKVAIINKNLKKDKFEYLIDKEGDFFNELDFNRLVADVIGSVSLLVVNGEVANSDNFDQSRLNEAKHDAYILSLMCISLLQNSENPGMKIYNTDIKNILYFNVRKYFQTNNSIDFDDIFSRIKKRSKLCDASSFNYRQMQMRLAKLEKKYQTFRQGMKKINCNNYDNASIILTKKYGFTLKGQIKMNSENPVMTVCRPGFGTLIAEAEYKQNKGFNIKNADLYTSF
jgi:hypothetical protein